MADLPEGMQNGAAKEFVERLSSESGTLVFIEPLLTVVGGCRNCNSPRCQCEARGSQNIAPASPSPLTPLTSDMPTPFTIPYSTQFSPIHSSHGHPHMYAPSSHQYPHPPQFPNASHFSGSYLSSPMPSSTTPSNVSTIPPNLNPTVTAHMEQFQKTQNRLLLQTQQRILQGGQSYRMADTRGFDPRSISNRSLVETYRHNLYDENPSLSFETSLPENSGHVAPTDQHHMYQNTGNLAGGSSALLSYTEDMLRPLFQPPYANVLPNNPYRQTSINHEAQKKSTNSDAAPPIISMNENEIGDYRAQFPPPYIGSGESHGKVHSTSNDSTEGSSVPHDLYGKLESQVVQPTNGKSGEVGEETASDEFAAYFGPEGADAEWLFTLRTECAVPGTECECGDSCCCPGCFTHTDNPGDRMIMDVMLKKIAGLQGDKEEQEEEGQLDMSAEKSTSSSTDSKL